MLKFFVTLQALIADRVERDDKGATVVEYGLIVGLVIGIVIAAMTLLDEGVTTLFTDVKNGVAGSTTTF